VPVLLMVSGNGRPQANVISVRLRSKFMRFWWKRNIAKRSTKRKSPDHSKASRKISFNEWLTSQRQAVV